LAGKKPWIENLNIKDSCPWFFYAQNKDGVKNASGAKEKFL
jgi:hypothetical protein